MSIQGQTRLPDVPVTETQARYRARFVERQFWFYLVVVAFVMGLISLSLAVYMGVGYLNSFGRTYKNDATHFKYGSIGAELANGLPYKLFLALPKIFPEKFAPEGDYSHFGFIYEKEGAPDPLLPIGFARGMRTGVEVAWFNCAVCHTGVVIPPGKKDPVIILGMPANTVNLEAFFLALFEMAVDKRFSWENKELRRAVGSDRMTWIDEIVWEWVTIPITRSTLIKRRSELLPLLDPKLVGLTSVNPKACQTRPAPYGCSRRGNIVIPKEEKIYEGKDATPREIYEAVDDKPSVSRQLVAPPPTPWGPGRVDTFNPYKLIQFEVPVECLSRDELTGATDFPAVFLQGPRGDQGMHLHWDGNNASLTERNLSASLGAGVTDRTVDHASLKRVATWLRDLTPPKNPYLETAAKVPPERMSNGKQLYQQYCTSCHGYQDGLTYRFEGAKLGTVEPLTYIGTDPARLNSYTVQVERYQKEQLFCREQDRRHRFRNFKKTNGYANLPLDFLWLRAPYLHNGSVPTLSDLLKRPEERPRTFVRGATNLDPIKGGFEAATDCDPNIPLKPPLFCVDTMKTGNGAMGHTYGTDLADADKDDLLQYLLTF